MSSLALRMLNNPGLIALTVLEEQKEIAAVGTQAPLKLQYIRRSAQCGLRLWNVLSPQLPGYATYGGDNGYPTFSLAGLKEKGLMK